jgi:hypothetical protein
MAYILEMKGSLSGNWQFEDGECGKCYEDELQGGNGSLRRAHAIVQAVRRWLRTASNNFHSCTASVNSWRMKR